MVSRQSEGLYRIRRFPPVVHPRHARELLVAHDDALLAEWVGAYAVTTPEHRQMLEDLLASLAWGNTGTATLIQGLYGTGKSHLLVLLHLLSVLPEAWPAVLKSYPIFRRFHRAITNRRLLVVHFSLDEYAPAIPLEEALQLEILRVFTEAGLPMPREWQAARSRLDAWSAALNALTAGHYQGLILLIDEVSLFLAGKSPAQREADAAFLQFLAGMTGRYPLWLLGALQRNLSDVGALRTHSWRQVEDRFRRYTLSPQEIGAIMLAKLIDREKPEAIRAAIADHVVPVALANGLPYRAAEFQMHWPFHPAAMQLLVEITNSYLSPHRSIVHVLQRMEETTWPLRSADHLITPLDLYSLISCDLGSDDRLAPLWKATGRLQSLANSTPDPALSASCLNLLVLLHLANRHATVQDLCELLFDGRTIPPLLQISQALHLLRRRGSHLAVARDNQPAQEVFSLLVDDEAGAIALARMEEMRLELEEGDARIAETVLRGCRHLHWPVAAALDDVNVPVQWYGERLIQLTLRPYMATMDIMCAIEGLCAGMVDGWVCMGWPDAVAASNEWMDAVSARSDNVAGLVVHWHPRPLNKEERELWREYACWQRASESDASLSPTLSPAIRRCRERADELQPAVEATVISIYLEGNWESADGRHGLIPAQDTMDEVLVALMASGLTLRFPLAPVLATDGAPAPTVIKQLMQYFVLPGELNGTAQSVLADYLQRYLEPLGCVEWRGAQASVAPPRQEIILVLLQALESGPVRLPEITSRLRRTPLGLSSEQCRLTLAAALRSGVIHGLDAFLQPLTDDPIILFLNDAIPFLALQPVLDSSYKSIIHDLASYWEMPDSPWPVACARVEHRLHALLQKWNALLPVAREMIKEWSALTGMPTWGWQVSETRLDALERMLTNDPLPFSSILEMMGDGMTFLTNMAALEDGVSWWRPRQQQLQSLYLFSWPSALNEAVHDIRARLEAGEANIPALPEIGKRLDQLLADYNRCYREWHDTLFGSQIVTELHNAFGSADFRAVKLLSQLPLPLPESAGRCLEALADAKMYYCPGSTESSMDDGRCARCHLPFGSPSPMPNSREIQRQAMQALEAYAELIRSHPRAGELRRKLARAPQEIAMKGEAFFSWAAGDGSMQLLELLDEKLLEWLCRDRKSVGIRHVADVQSRLAGHDLTLAETLASVREWLDPERTLEDKDLLSFE